MHRVAWLALVAMACGSEKESARTIEVERTTREPKPEPKPKPEPEPKMAEPVDDPRLANKELAVARKGFVTKLVAQTRRPAPPEAPPPQMRLVKYDAPAGKLSAYLTPDPGDGKKRAGIVWITGGDCNTIGDVWSPMPASNDQSARQYRDAGVVTMYPSLRGGNDNPGKPEGYYGEVDDVLAAADFLAKQPHVDPRQLYLGGHSTGATLALLVAAVAGTDRFRGVFAFGPAESVEAYGLDDQPFDTGDPTELALRAPVRWVNSIGSFTFIIEGSDGNAGALAALKKANKNPRVQVYLVEGAGHFNLLAPLNRAFATEMVGRWAFGPVEMPEEFRVPATTR